MKRLNIKIIYTQVLIISMVMQSCDQGFEDLNQNPDALQRPIPEYIFTKAQLDAFAPVYWETAIIGAGGFVQQYATYKDIPALGDRYLYSQATYAHTFFAESYPNAVNEIGEVIQAVTVNPGDVNKLSAARIWRVYMMHRITDLYGDVPYSEAGQGFTKNIFTPKYDEQSEIYPHMLKELEEAAAAFDANAPTFGNADLLYNGDVGKWKKFAYSLMLRLGMRLTKVDISSAESWVKKAIAGGVITQDADIAMIAYTDGPQAFNRNPYANSLLGGDYGAFGIDNKEGGKLAKTFIDHLKNTNDPRLNAIAVVWNGTTADTTTALQKGLPNGLEGNLKPVDFVTYSEPNPATVLKYSSPVMVITNAEVNLLLAEAAVRGWYSGDAAEAYKDGVEASMHNWNLFLANVVSPGKVASYLNTEGVLTSGTMDEKLEQIHTQFWVALYPDEYEIYANYRRTGYPVLIPLNAAGNVTNGTIPRRLIYPASEEGNNSDNYSAAISKIPGGNVFTGRVWWDKP